MKATGTQTKAKTFKITVQYSNISNEMKQFRGTLSIL